MTVNSLVDNTKRNIKSLILEEIPYKNDLKYQTTILVRSFKVKVHIGVWVDERRHLITRLYKVGL